MTVNRKIEFTIDVIVHSTEDATRIIRSLTDILGLDTNDIASHQTLGYYDNPITLLSHKITGRRAKDTIKVLTRQISDEQTDMLVSQIHERTANSRFHMRLDKQELVRGMIRISNDGAIRIGIQTPIYNKSDTAKVFTEMLQRYGQM